ncbi:MAG TPA: hypothetical protein VLE23_06290 [Geminicoccaceae bacterium]|nr:hypothetical protein [Geminicoccaceae bacterium]
MADGSESSKDFWEKFSVISGFLAAVFMPLALGLAGHWFASAITERENRLKQQEFFRQWVQLALDILRDPGTAQQKDLREWAIAIVNHYTDPAIQMQSGLQKSLAGGQVRLPEPSQSRVQQMEALETKALEALLERDLDTAIAVTETAHALWGDFRTVWEMLRLLRAERASFAGAPDPSAWQALYSKLDTSIYRI